MEFISEHLNKLEAEESFVQNMIESDICTTVYDKNRSMRENHSDLTRIRQIGEDANFDNFISPKACQEHNADMYDQSERVRLVTKLQAGQKKVWKPEKFRQTKLSSIK